MSSVEWNKKEDLVADQALRHLKVGLCQIRSSLSSHLPFMSVIAMLGLRNRTLS